jgi:long-chain acyl-CoA synthetase
MTYEESLSIINNISNNLLEISWKIDEVLSTQFSSVLFLLGFFGSSSIEWLLTLIACLKTPIVTVGLYNNVQELINWSESLQLKHLFTSSDKLSTIFGSCESGLLQLTLIIVVGSFSKETEEEFLEIGVKLVNFHQLAQGNGRAKADLTPAEHPCFLSLTAGTTESPRFVVVNQVNLLSTLHSCFHLAQEVSSEDSYLSYMNFSLLGEVVFIFLISLTGGRVGLAFEPLNFLNDAQVLKPTFMISVPIIIEKLYSGIRAKVDSLTGLSKSMFNKGFAKKLENYKKTGELKHKIWDSLAFKSIKNLLGGKLRVLVIGTAMCSKDITRFLKIVLGCEILEGYGMIESTVTAFCTYPGDPETGTIGGPLLGIEARLHYTGMIFEEYTHYYGELQLRGPSICQSYYGLIQPSIDKDGWYTTGDIVALIPETGALSFIDRKSFIYKSRSGKSICSQKLEVLYKQSKLISQLLIIGHSSLEGVVAIVVANSEYIQSKWKVSNLSSFIKSKEFEDAVYREFLVIERIYKLKEHEKILQVWIESEPWDSDELVTQTLKLRKYRLVSKYSAIVDQLAENYLKNSYN